MTRPNPCLPHPLPLSSRFTARHWLVLHALLHMPTQLDSRRPNILPHHNTPPIHHTRTTTTIVAAKWRHSKRFRRTEKVAQITTTVFERSSANSASESPMRSLQRRKPPMPRKHHAKRKSGDRHHLKSSSTEAGRTIVADAVEFAVGEIAAEAAAASIFNAQRRVGAHKNMRSGLDKGMSNRDGDRDGVQVANGPQALLSTQHVQTAVLDKTDAQGPKLAPSWRIGMATGRHHPSTGTVDQPSGPNNPRCCGRSGCRYLGRWSYRQVEQSG